MKNSKYIIIFFIFSNMIFSQGVKTFFKSPEGKFFISSARLIGFKLFVLAKTSDAFDDKS